jgi:Zn-dependent protease
MGMSWKIGRVAGIDLFLHPTFFLVLLFGAARGGLVDLLLVTAVFGCVVLHELGHALTARLYGIQTEDITLYPIGGVARLQRMPRKPGAEFLITIAGPLVNLAIAGVLALVLSVSGAGLAPSWETGPALVDEFLSALMAINLFLAAFNMIPAFPMDGGRILRALLSGWLGRLRATEIAAGVGKVLAIGFGIWSLMHFDLIRACLAGFIYFAAQSELMQARDEEWRRHAPPPPKNDQDLWFAPPGYEWVSRDDGVWRLAPAWVTVRDQDSRRWR